MRHSFIRLSAFLLLLWAVWLVVTPWILPQPYPQSAVWIDFTAGLALGLLALIQLLFPLLHWTPWAGIALGLWLLFSPWIAGYAEAPPPVYNAATSATGVLICISAALVGTFAATGRSW